MTELKLVYVNYVGEDYLGNKEYEFYFSQTPEIVWGYDWDSEVASYGDIQPPDKQTYSEIKRLVTNIPFHCVQDNNGYGMIYAVNDIISICFEDISEYEEYPDGRLVFHFGENFNDVVDKLSYRELEFKEYDNQEAQ